MREAAGGAVRAPASRSTAACPPLRSKRATRPSGSNSTLRPFGDAPVRPLRFPRAPPCARPSSPAASLKIRTASDILDGFCGVC